ncbi:MAG TPA: hypothetical protein VN709_11220 [Terriglobales bacterium]|nr:hypothetical protein [Terriglobales bacterium]
MRRSGGERRHGRRIAVTRGIGAVAAGGYFIDRGTGAGFYRLLPGAGSGGGRLVGYGRGGGRGVRTAVRFVYGWVSTRELHGQHCQRERRGAAGDGDGHDHGAASTASASAAASSSTTAATSTASAGGSGCAEIICGSGRSVAL